MLKTETAGNDFICEDCATEYCKNTQTLDLASWQEGLCFVCEEKKPTTKWRDYGEF